MSPHYLLIGSGRVSRHFRFYLQQLAIPYSTWSRRENSPSELAPLVERSSHIWLLISDSSIDSFALEHSALWGERVLLHASGAHVSRLARGVHPLMTLIDGPPYPLATYQEMPLVIDASATQTDPVPLLPNRRFFIDPKHKPLYHALCAMSGNFTVLLWQKAMREMGSVGLSAEVLVPYLKQTTFNLVQTPDRALTGPIARGDRATIEKHITALGDDPFAGVYRAFVAASVHERNL